MIALLHDNSPFPPLAQALRAPNGLLAAGGSLTPARLLDAYRLGIFPWFSADDPILWWSPDPRMVLFPEELSVSHSLRKTLRNRVYEVRTDTAFEQVMRACAAPRGEHSSGCDTLLAEPADGGSSRLVALPAPEGSASPCQGGHTWIHEEMIAAYTALHRTGYAHSVETWQDGELMGGLYGVSIGRMFYGESMFSRKSDASKVALAHLAMQSCPGLEAGMIDCQMHTPHLASLGAREIPRAEFIRRMQELVHCPHTATPREFEPVSGFYNSNF